MTENPTKSNRRNVLKALGIGAGSFSLQGLVSVPTEAKEEVPERQDRDGTIHTMEVSKKWADHHRETKEKISGLHNQVLHRPGVESVARIRGEEMFGEKYGFNFEVCVNKDKFDGDVPTHYRGVPVKKTEIESEESPEFLCYNYGNYSPMEGGMAVQKDTSTASRGTTGYKVKLNGTDMMLTAKHLFDKCGWAGDESAYGSSLKYGDIVWENGTYDIALIEPDSGGVQDDIERESDEIDIGGVIKSWGVASAVTDPWDSYEKMGTTTGQTSGGLTADNASGKNCADLNGNGVKGTAKAGGGDSGGPAYQIQSGKAYLLYNISIGTGGYSSKYDSCANQSVTIRTESAGAPAHKLDDLGVDITW